MNVRTALMGLFVALTIVFASTTVYESGTRTTLTSTTTSTSTATSVSTITSTTTQTTTLTSTFDLAQSLTDAYLSHFGAIESRNATALAVQYETNATLLYASPDGVVFSSQMNGSVDGIANITRFYERNNSQAAPCVTCFELKAPFAAANETYSIMLSSDDEAANVTSHLVFYGTLSYGSCYVPGVGGCNTAVYAMVFDISYVLQGDSWLISTESLTYINWSTCSTAYLLGSAFHCELAS